MGAVARCGRHFEGGVAARAYRRASQPGAALLILSALIVGAPFPAGAFIDRGFSDPVFLVLVLVCTWPATVTPIHHELAHLVVARHFGIEVTAFGLHVGGAHVVLHPTSTGIHFRAWIWTLSAGLISNAIVGVAVLVGFPLVGGGWFSTVGLFCVLVGSIELSAAVANGLPGTRSDGRAIVDALRMARPPVVI